MGVFTAGGMVATLFYYIWESWQITTIFVVIFPSMLFLILSIIFLKETPMFLIKNDPEDTVKVLNKIG